MRPADLPEGPYALPAVALAVTGLSPHMLRALIEPGCPVLGEPAVIRSGHFCGRLLVHLGDVLLMAGALADSGIKEGRP
jgi:hypothetical protein